MSTGTICLLISAGIMIIVTIYLDIVSEQVAEINENAEDIQSSCNRHLDCKDDQRQQNFNPHYHHYS